MTTVTRSTLKQVLAGIVLTLSLGLVAAPVANAAVVGPNVNGCKGEIWNTAFNSYCNTTTAAGYYSTKGTCSSQDPVWGPEVWKSKGYKGYVSAGECRFSVTFAKTYYTK